MHLHIELKITVNAGAEKVWKVLAHDFEAASDWASVITESWALTDGPVRAGANVGGRVCMVPGLGETHEVLTHYDERARVFTYRAAKGLPSFVKDAENNWSVQELGPEKSEVTARAEMDFKRFPGVFLAPLFKFQIRRLGRRTFEDLKYFIEQGEAHPRKARVRLSAKHTK